MKTLNIKNSDRIRIPAFCSVLQGGRLFMTGVTVLISILLLASCKKFVDVKRSSSQLNLSTANDCQLMLDNYAAMNTNYPVDAEISSDNYFLSDFSYNTDPDNGITPEEKLLYAWDPGAIRKVAAPNWQNPYKTIYIANLVREAVEQLEGGNTDPVVLNNLKGTCLFYRAYCLWVVAQMYAKPYGSSSSVDPGIPIRLTSNINEKSVRGTVQQTYARITGDLTEAVNLLQPTSSISTRPNKAAAYAMLARVYLSMEDYPNALSNADAALQLNSQLLDYKTISQFSSSPFTRFNKEVIFHTIATRAPILNQGASNPTTARVDSLLAISYQTGDLRGKIFLKANTKTVNNNEVPDGTYRFSGNYEPSVVNLFFTGLAVDELYLTRAECYARAGNVTQALFDLNTLLKTRWNAAFADVTASSADDALAKILVERRKELLMRGLRWTDLRRLNKDTRFKKDLVRKQTVNGVPVTFTLPANDPRYTLLIPQEVITLSGIAQNTR